MNKEAKPHTVYAAPSVDAAFSRSLLGVKLRDLMNKGKGNNAVIAEYILRNPVRSTACSIEEMAELTGTSAPSLSRFARTVGYSGYAALRTGLADSLQGALEPVEKLRELVHRSSVEVTSDHPVIPESMEKCLAQLKGTASSLGTPQLTSIAHKILAAQTVYTLGFGISAHLAAILALHLQPFCRQCINVVEFGGTEVAAGRLMSIGPRDVLISLSFPRYASDAVSLTQYARDRFAQVVVITDSMASPLTQWSSDVLLAPAQHLVLSGTYVPALLVIEALVSCLLVNADNQVGQAQKLTEAISAYLYDTAVKS
jgi:DNA-binding MurR/RpiR family transcriptional regulator